MNRACIAAVALGALALSGCKKPDAAAPSSEVAAEDLLGPLHPARYQGVGIYSPDHLWAKMAGAATPKDAASALVVDDSQVIVVVDARTGEIRQCGNRSGTCVAMNPWDRRLVQPLTMPVALSEHEKPEPAPQPVPVAAPEQTRKWMGRHRARAAAPPQTASKADGAAAPVANPIKP